MPYVARAGSPGDPCIFCAALAAGDDRRALVLERGERAFLILNAFPYASGHLMAAPVRHVAALEEATRDELAETMQLVQRGVGALRAAYGADGFNVGLNQGRAAGAGIPDHLHVHVVPRWNGDTNFMPVLGGTKVIPEALDTSYDRLLAVLRP
jgi:ATP adenylyltransferase